ncbi:MAG: acetate--CoA ligase family protein [Thermoplasmata archaeon]|nr:acetate--CoA ligase family protein [Thermoplasmata archaeon]
MNEYEAKKFLKKYGINIPPGTLIRTPEEVESIDLNYPLVAKVVRDDIIHKSDVGGVILNIRNGDELRDAIRKINQKFDAPALVEEMQKGGVEIIVGVLKDSTFGHAIMFGLGGIFTEVFRDVTFRVIPITDKDAELMLSEIRGRKILEGYRGIKVNREAIIDLLLSVSKLVEENPQIKGMDLNPVLAREKDCVVLDAKIIEK